MRARTKSAKKLTPAAQVEHIAHKDCRRCRERVIAAQKAQEQVRVSRRAEAVEAGAVQAGERHRSFDFDERASENGKRRRHLAEKLVEAHVFGRVDDINRYPNLADQEFECDSAWNPNARSLSAIATILKASVFQVIAYKISTCLIVPKLGILYAHAEML